MADLALIVQNMLRDEMVDYDRAERIAVAVEQAVRERIAADIKAWQDEHEGDVFGTGPWSSGARYALAAAEEFIKDGAR